MQDVLSVSLPVDFRYTYNGDYNGDGWPDLVILCDKLCFYKGNANNTYTFVEEVLFEEVVTHFTIQDISTFINYIDFDAENDLILLLQSGKLQIHYHKMNTKATKTLLCALIEKPYDFQISNTGTKQIQQIILKS